MLELARPCGAAVPAERLGVELECTTRRAQRLLLVGEDARCEQVQESMLPRVGRIRVMQPRRRLEDDVGLAAAAHERRQLLYGRDRSAAAADLRGSLDVELVALPLGAASDARELATLHFDALGHDEAAEEPCVRACLRARVLGERVGERHARRREERRMVEEPAQKRPCSVHERQSYTPARVGLRAVEACEPRQIRKEAALSIPFQVRGQPGPYDRSMAALYRKYRPQSFDEVVGQEAVVRTLKNAITAGQVRQAY